MATTQPAQTPAQAPAQTFEGGDVAMVRVAHLSPNTPTVNIVLLQEDGTVGIAGEQTGAVQEAPATTQEPVTQEPVTQEPATEEPMTQAPADAGVIEVVINPPEADDAIISIAGPDGFEDTFTGEQTLTDLVPGTYVLNATREGFEAASEEFEVGAGETARVEVTFVEAAGDEAAAQRQAAQPMTEAQEQQFAEREQRIAAQQPAVQEGLPGLDALENLSYEDVTDYVPVLAGNYIVQVQTADDSALAYEGTLNLAAGAYYTVAAIGFALETEEGIQPTTEATTGQGQGFFDWLGGLFGGQDAPAPDDVNLRLQVYDDEPGNFPDAGNANIRVIHASAGSPNVDLVSSRGAMPATAQPETQAAATPAATTEQPATATAETAEPAADMGMLEITVNPPEAEDAVITVVGPDGYEENFTGPQAVSDLAPGTYLISATHEDYEAVSQEVQLEAGQTATVELNLEGDATGAQEDATAQEDTVAQETATTDQPAADMGMLEIVINPPEADDAIVSIAGPDGFQDEFSGAQTLTDLAPGTYGLNATREGFEAASEEFEVNAGETVRVEITFVEIAGDDAVAQRQAAQPLTAEQQQQFAQRQEAVTTQDPVVQDPAVTTTDPGVTDPLVTDPLVTDPALDEQVIAGGLIYGASSGYQALRALESQNLTLRVAGADPAETILDLSDADIEPGHVYTIFITGTTFEDYPLSYIMVTDASLGGGTGEANGASEENGGN
ncbi:MAG: hypothetical protein M3511_09730 [Deinococcota bacterium]|nr:hypothetical protein [Deinococcota bacterium]